ncbi:DUF3558 family protein [Corynebacterium mycetoides]|uniref:DUF3558 family protein n=1 Tax=Corynebacterium mycetoides TaxID=38302 RepID=UPI0038B401A9
MGVRVKHFRVVAGLVALCSVVTGCAGPSASDSAGSVAPSESVAEAPAFHFESGDLVIGPFDPEEVKHNLFDPCTEISDAEFAAAGLVKSAEQPGQGDFQKEIFKGCLIDNGDPFQTVLVVSNSASRSHILRDSPQLDAPSPHPPSAFAFGPPNGSSDMCDVAVETNRGTLSVSVADELGTSDLKSLCARSSAVLSSIYRGSR